MVDKVRSSGLVIYGAGYWGKISLQIFALFNVAPLCFCDDDLDKQGTCLIQDDVKIPIISLDEAVKKYPNAVYFAAASTANGRMAPTKVMRSSLREHGVISEYSGFHPIRYLFLLEGGLEALKRTDRSESTNFQIESFKNLIVSNHMGNSGSVYFNTLLEGHPNIVTIPLLRDKLAVYYRKRLQYLEGEELLLETVSQVFQYFGYQPTRLAHWFLDRNAQPEERIYINSVKFITALGDLLPGRGKVSFAVLLKAVHAAYANCTGKVFDPKQTYWIYVDWHLSNFDTRALDGLLSPDDFVRLEYWFVIREPIQQLFSGLNRFYLESPHFHLFLDGADAYIDLFSGELGLMLEKTEATKNKIVKIVRFEDVKKRTRETMQAVSKWMDIPFDEGMLNTTMNGVPVYFPSVAGDTRNVISSSDTTAVDRKDFSMFMTSYDIFRLNLVFQNFKKAYGYECDVPDYRDFSPEFLLELYKHPFRFEAPRDIPEAESKTKDVLSPEDCLFHHERITNLFMSYMQKEEHELITDVIWPQEAEEEK